jgi:hypothetical protein
MTEEIDLATAKLLLEDMQTQVAKLQIRLLAIGEMVGVGDDEDLLEAIKRRTQPVAPPPAKARPRDSKATT